MYAIHTTPGFVIDSRPRGEAGKLLSIFTRDLGLITASAQGIRFEKSKLRYYTQDHSFGTFSLVRGKEFWRLTSAAEHLPGSLLENDGKSVTLEKSSKGMLVARIALLLRRFLQGEEPHPELYTCVEACVGFLNANPGLNVQQLGAFESLTVLKILNALGYVGSDPILAGYLSTVLTVGLLDEAAKEKSAINRHINKALKESHL